MFKDDAELATLADFSVNNPLLVSSQGSSL